MHTNGYNTNHNKPLCSLTLVYNMALKVIRDYAVVYAFVVMPGSDSGPFHTG